MNIHHGLTIVYAAMHKTKTKEEIEESIDQLVMTERIETVIPLTYMAIVALSYFSPNAELMMGMKLTLWHNVAIDDLAGMMTNLALLFFVDLSSFVLNGILLRWFLKINVIHHLKRVQKMFWIIMVWEDASIFLEVIIIIIHIDLFKLFLYLRDSTFTDSVLCHRSQKLKESNY